MRTTFAFQSAAVSFQMAQELAALYTHSSKVASAF